MALPGPQGLLLDTLKVTREGFGGQATLHWPELGRWVTSNCQEVWEMSGYDLREKSQNALDHRGPVSGPGLRCEF